MQTHSLARTLTGVALVTAFFIGCFACPQRDHDRPYRSGTIERWNDGSLRKAKLVEETALAGLPAKRGGWVRFHENGVLEGLQLGRDTTVVGRVLPKGTYVWFDELGNLDFAWPTRDMTYEGVPCAGGWGKVSTSFYPDGSLRTVFLAEDAVIQGIPCRATGLEPVRFHPDGRLASAELSEDFTYRGTDYERKQVIRLDAAPEPVDAD